LVTARKTGRPTYSPLARATREKRCTARSRAPTLGSRRVFTNREEEGSRVARDNPRIMKTTEIHDDRCAAARWSPGIVRRGMDRLRARSGGAERRERGAVAVEFALIVPLLVVLSFGIVEFSSAYHDSSAAADAARAGARVGSAKATQADFATAAAAAASSAVKTLPSDVPQELWVYKANSSGYPGSGTSFSSCGTSCIRYSYSAAAKAFVPSGGGGWAASSHQVCTQPYDEIGVYIKLQHPFVTKLFGAGVTLTDHAVFRFEPVASSACGF
jgi:hypothetical protein